MKRVLIIDDGVFMRMLIREMFTRNGYEIVGEAEDGLIGIEKYAQLKPDLVTLDITMPNLDGLETLKRIMQKDPQASVVMVSSMGQEENIRQAILTGAKGFLVKPFDEVTFLSVIQSIKY